MRNLEIFIDGACQGNPGWAGIGVVVCEKGKTIKELSQFIGHATNNIAEYTALVFGLQEALILRADKVLVTTDSELLFHQIEGSYKVKDVQLKFLNAQVKHLITGIKDFKIQHVMREGNRKADTLATQAIKNEQAKAVAPKKKKVSQSDLGTLFKIGEESPSSIG